MILKVDRCHFVWYRFGSKNVDKHHNNYQNSWEIVNESKAKKYLVDWVAIQQKQ